VDLDRTFRFNNKISDVASHFVQSNPEQLRKTIETHAKSDRTEIAVISNFDKTTSLHEALDAVAARAGGKKASVFLLARYNDSEPKNLKELQRQYPNLDLTFLSVHRSKGLEADYVIILDMIEGKKGFPSQMATDPIIEFILPNAEKFKDAEERRLFYVALTRARHSVWLLTHPGMESPFVTELLQGGYDVHGDREAMKATVRATARCPVCLEGLLERRSTRKGVYYVCSLSPYCEGSAIACPACGNGSFTSDGHHHRCSNPDCSFEAETCPSCGVGYIRLITSGPYGPFYSCSNWRGDGPTSCNYKQKVPQTSI
jgi:DNA helicase-4